MTLVQVEIFQLNYNTMGKSFKTIIKPESQKDILDLTIEEKEHNITSVTSITPPKSPKNEDSTKDLRQTILISPSNFERLKNYVHTRRINGEYDYSQKNAFKDALELLFKDIAIIERPQSVIQKELHRSDVLRSSLKKN